MFELISQKARAPGVAHAVERIDQRIRADDPEHVEAAQGVERLQCVGVLVEQLAVRVDGRGALAEGLLLEPGDPQQQPLSLLGRLAPAEEAAEDPDFERLAPVPLQTVTIRHVPAGETDDPVAPREEGARLEKEIARIAREGGLVFIGPPPAAMVEMGDKVQARIAMERAGLPMLPGTDVLRTLNEAVYRDHPDAMTVAEESTAWPMVSRPTYVGGLGFGMKWNMGWMHDTLAYMKEDPINRRYHHGQLTFSLIYAFNENFVLPLSHDEVVHGKGSLVGKMPGDDWQKFANLRLTLAYMWAQPGKKLLFMGGEIGQWREWHHDESLDWHLLQYAPHEGVRRLVADINRVYRSEPALFERDCDPAGFEWVDCADWQGSALAFLRRGRGDEAVLVACNFTPVPRLGYRIGVPAGGVWSVFPCRVRVITRARMPLFPDTFPKVLFSSHQDCRFSASRAEGLSQ